jgi:hypothetical protein
LIESKGKPPRRPWFEVVGKTHVRLCEVLVL